MLLQVSSTLSSVSLWSNPSIVTQGSSEVFTATISGGSSAYTYNFMLSNSADANPIISNLITINALASNTFTFTFPSTNNALGTLTYSVAVTDSATVNEMVTMTNTITINTASLTCTFTASNSAINFGTIDLGGAVATQNVITITNSGNSPSNILVSGTDWAYLANSFGVQNTVWYNTYNHAYASSTALTGSNVDTKIDVIAGATNTVYFGVGIPTSPSVVPATWTQTLSVVSNC